MKYSLIILIIFLVLSLIILFKGKVYNVETFNPDTHVTHDTPVIIYYHIAEIGEWENIVKEQLQQIIQSGLYHRCQEIRIGFLGEKSKIINYVKGKVKLVYHSTNVKEYEIPTINSLLAFSKKCQKEHYILYIHNKGSTNRMCNGVNGQYYWRQMMNYWTIQQYQLCLSYLNKSFLTCGINVAMDYSHYSGNFWWSRTSYLKILDPIKNLKDRLLSEFWLLKKRVKNKNISLYGPYISSYACSGLYSMKIDSKTYKNTDIKIF